MTDRIDVHFDGLDEVINMMERASKVLPAAQLAKFEASWDALDAEIRARVHVDTGRLKLSGRSTTHYDGDTWQGEITYRSNPGIFELARGDAPTRSHPDGGHFFFDPFNSYDHILEENVNQALDYYFEAL